MECGGYIEKERSKDEMGRGDTWKGEGRKEGERRNFWMGEEGMMSLWKEGGDKEKVFVWYGMKERKVGDGEEL